MGRIGIDWITDRRPTEDDGDHDGYVIMRRNPVTSQGIGIHWTYVNDAPWTYSPFYKQPEKPQPIPRKFASITRTVHEHGHTLDAISDDGSAWCLIAGDDHWEQLPDLPARQPK